MIKNNYLSLDAIRCILGLDKNLIIDHLEMAKNLKVTFYPYEGIVSKDTRLFYSKLREAFEYYGVSIVPYHEALIEPGQRLIKKGLCLVVLGEQDKDHMPIECLPSYRENFILTILDDTSFIPSGLHKKSYKKQADYGYNLITWHFSNYIIAVSKNHWVNFSGNGMFDVNEIDYNDDFKQKILSSIISKLFAPLLPIPMSEFTIIDECFEPSDPDIAPYVDDLIKGAKIFSKTHLLDYKIKFENMILKKDVYKKILKIVFDNRSGAHLGYLSRQLPTRLPDIFTIEDAKNKFGIEFHDKDYTFFQDEIYLKFDLPDKSICLKVPDIWTITSISGAEKNNLKTSEIIKMGLKAGRMYLQFPKNAKIDLNIVRPSFDTKVILSNALSSAIYAGIMKFYKPELIYPSLLEKQGMALAHWHGYILPAYVPGGWVIHGEDYPVCMCSAHQAAVYGFMGKENAMLSSIFNSSREFLGDIHVEPQHGVNMSWESVKGLAKYLLSSDRIAKNGNEYFKYLKYK